MRMRKGILGVAVTLAVAGLGLWSGMVAHAAESVYYNYADALAGAPQGVDLNSDEYKDYFWHGDDISGATSSNSATLVDAGKTGANNSAIRISRAGETNTWGAIWSNDKVFDLMKPQTASMWVYASTEAAYVKAGLGDGMAFVLQNSKDGVHAFSKAGMPDKNNNTVYTPGTGESMGVWGMDPKDWHSTDLAKNAISNSWALEFDTFNNTYDPPTKTLILGNPQWNLNAPYAPSSFDLGSYYNSFDASGKPTGSAGKINGSDNHIASNYPGDSATYTGVSRDGYRGNIWGQLVLGTPNWYTNDYTSSSYYFYKMTHLGYLDEGKNADATTDKLTDHRWHHVTLTYTPPTSVDGIGKMKYVYDDKNSDTGADKTPANSAEVPIKLSEFGISADSTKVRWGFTGSTGTSTENNLVIFDQVPGDVENSSSATLSAKGDSGNYTPVDSTASTPTLSGGTPVKLDYIFRRDGGLKAWQDVNASLTIPKSIQLTSGEIKNPDGSDGGSVDISKLNGTTLPVSMGSNGNGVTLTGTQNGEITLYGTIADGEATESSSKSYFKGSNASSTAEMTGFKVSKSRLAMDIDDATSTLHVNYEGALDANVIGVVVPDDKNVMPADVTIHPTLNGTDLDTFKQGDSDYYEGTHGTTGFKYDIPISKLKPGSNTISFYATDTNPDDGRSPVVSTEVIAGTVDLGDTSEDMSFGNMTLTGSGANTTLKRDNDWGLDVIDSRAPGSDDWQLYAYADPLTTDPKQTAVPTTLDGYLVYPSADGTDKPLGTSPGTATQVASGAPSGDDTTKTTNIAEKWTDNSGIRLLVRGGATAGNYSGSIHWTFVNSAG
ncbi:hypothetical protein [Levilactobacillus parabrevis]|uniref:hypothetical protein n=1 Tax=Levilactobacillus parabrevis TaxID=357278 RepID=UPI0021A39866|nr:hypothetical protein [Levilactobacillus parabrevis]MCT4490165.1 hypothetical protein [Levilactobacillus parabrevis]